MATDAQKEAARQRQANKRARDRGLPEPYPRIDREEVAQRVSQHETDLAWALAQDAQSFYKSECRSCVDLLAIYEGADILSKEDDEETSDDKKKPKKKENRPNPSQQKISIRAVEYNGILLEPDCDFEFRKLNEIDEVVSFQRWLDLRDKARKDLFWLGRALGKGLFHSFHQELCDQFVVKNFGGTSRDGVEMKPMYFKDFTIDDFHDMLRAQKRFSAAGVPTREALILDPRGSYKSTVDGIDVVSWLLNCPDIRVMIITAFKHLAKRFLKEIKGYFYLAPKAQPKTLHLLFPEYILLGVDGTSKEPLECPAALLGQKEHSVWVTSIESSNTGMHCDLRKADDVVDPKNSNTKELREQLKFDFDSTDDLLDQWGFSDVIGTRYFTDDWYGTRMLPDENSEVAPFKYHCRGSWIVKPEYRSVPLKQLTKEMVTLLFPYKLSWGYLKYTLTKKGERSFRNQQLNDPTDAGEDSAYINQFDEDILRAHSYPFASSPKEGDIFIAWDWAYSDKKTSDYSVGVAARVYQRPDKQYALCVLEIIFDKWKSSELVFQIISFYQKWKPKKVLIENSNGADLLKDNILVKAQILGSDILHNVYWMPPSSQSNAKRNRIKSLEVLLKDDRLHFVNGSWIDETFKQLTKYTGEKSTAVRKDDIPDGMAYLVEFLPKSALKRDVDPKVAEKEAEEMAAKAAMAAWKNRIFGSNSGNSTPPPSTSTPPAEPAPDPRRAAMGRIFGGNGMRA